MGGSGNIRGSELAAAKALGGGAVGAAFSSISDVRVRLRMENGRQVRQEIIVTGNTFVDNLGTKPTQAIIQTEQSIGTLIAQLFNLRSIVATVGKALLSGFAISAVFFALFAVFNTLRKLFIELPQEILNSVNALKEMDLSMQALLATTTEFSTNIKENFRIAAISARELRDELLLLDPITLGGLRELQTATQALLATGAIGLVDSANASREIAQTASLLVNAVVLVTGRVNDQRQIFSEIKELMLGNVRSQNQVAQLIASQVGSLDDWLMNIRENGNLLEEMRRVLGGINEAADEFLNTLTSVAASQQAITDIIREAAFEEQVESLIKRQRALVDLVTENKDVIALSNKEMSFFVFAWEKIKLRTSEVATFLQIQVGRALELRDALLQVDDALRMANAQRREGGVVVGPTRAEFLADQPSPVGAVRSLVVVTAITDEVEKLNSKMVKFNNLVVKSGEQALSSIEAALFKLNNTLFATITDLVQPLIEARQDLAAVFTSPRFAVSIRKRALESFDELGVKLDNIKSQMDALGTNTAVKLRKKIEEQNEKTALSFEKTIFRARIAFIRNFNDMMEEFVSAGEAVTDRRARAILKRISESVSIAKALRDARSLDLAGLNITLTVEEKVNRARQEGLEKMFNILNILKKSNATVALRETIEANITDRINEQTAALTEQLGKQRSQIIVDALRAARNFSIAGLQKTFSIEEQVNSAREAGLATMVGIDRILEAQNVSLAFRRQVEMEIRDLIEEQTRALQTQLELDQFLREGREIQRRFRLEREGVILPGVEPVGIRGLLERRGETLGRIDTIGDEGPFRPEDLTKLRTELAAIESQLLAVVTGSNSVAQVISGAMTTAFLNLLDKGTSIKKFFTDIQAALKAVGETLIFAFGQALANAIQGLITGTSGFKQAIGGLIIAIGNLAISMGTILILGTIFLGFGAAAQGVALIAAGAGMIALGHLIGGSGAVAQAAGAVGAGSIPTFRFNQAQVPVQQVAGVGGFVTTQTLSTSAQESRAVVVTENLVVATNNLVTAQSQLTTMPAGVVFKKGARENGGLVTSVAREAKEGKNLSATRSLALTLRGGGNG